MARNGQLAEGIYLVSDVAPSDTALGFGQGSHDALRGKCGQ